MLAGKVANKLEFHLENDPRRRRHRGTQRRGQALSTGRGSVGHLYGRNHPGPAFRLTGKSLPEGLRSTGANDSFQKKAEEHSSVVLVKATFLNKT